jgi:hypothetical protein
LVADSQIGVIHIVNSDFNRLIDSKIAVFDYYSDVVSITTIAITIDGYLIIGGSLKNNNPCVIIDAKAVFVFT